MNFLKPILCLFFALTTIVLIWIFLARPQPIPYPDIPAGQSLQCASYTPFDKDEAPWLFASKDFMASEARLDQDLKVIANHFSCIRTYSSVGYDLLPAVAQKYGLKVMLGIWVNDNKKTTQKEIKAALNIIKNNRATISSVVVGNEVLLRKELTSRQLAKIIRGVKNKIGDIPVTYGDVTDFWYMHPELGPAVDFLLIHILPYWINDPVPIDQVSQYFESEYQKLASRFLDKKIMIGETGWPSFGRMRVGSLPTRVNEATYLRAFVSLAKQKGWQYNLFEAFDQPWKRLNEGAVGGFWGIYDKDRKDKSLLAGPVSNYPDAVLLCLASALLCLLGTGFAWKALCNNTVFGRMAAIVMALAIGPVLISLQAHEFAMTMRTPLEWAWSGLAFVLIIFAYFLLVYMLFSGDRPTPLSLKSSLDQNTWKKVPFSFSKLYTLWFWPTAFLLALETLGFVFDARYRSFANWGFLVTAGTAIVATQQTQFSKAQPNAPFLPEKALGLVLLCCTTFLLVNETPLNWQADLWVGIVTLWVYALWAKAWNRAVTLIKDFSPAIQLVLKSLLWFFVPCCLAAMLRFYLMQSTGVANRCSENPALGLCQIRSFLGILIHFRVFPKLAIVLIMTSWFVNNQRVKWWLAISGFVFSVPGLLLYNVETAAWVALVGFLWVALLQTTSQKPDAPK